VGKNARSQNGVSFWRQGRGKARGRRSHAHGGLSPTPNRHERKKGGRQRHKVKERSQLPARLREKKRKHLTRVTKTSGSWRGLLWPKQTLKGGLRRREKWPFSLRAKVWRDARQPRIVRKSRRLSAATRGPLRCGLGNQTHTLQLRNKTGKGLAATKKCLHFGEKKLMNSREHEKVEGGSASAKGKGKAACSNISSTIY